MMVLLTEFRENVPHFAWLVGCPLAVLLAQLVFLRLALRRRRTCLALEDKAEAGDLAAVLSARLPGAWTDLTCALSVLLVPATAAWCLATARTGFLAAMNAARVEDKAEGISRNLSGMLNAVPWSINFVVVCTGLAIASLSLSVTARRRMGRIKAAASGTAMDPAALAASRGPGGDNVAVIPAAFFALGFFPVLEGAWAFCLHLIRGLAVPPHMPGEEKALRLFESLDQARALFAGRAALAVPGTLVAAAGSIALVWRWRRHRAAAPKDEVPWTTAVGVPFHCLCAALACWLVATPFREENRMPWPPPRPGGDNLLVDEPQAPPLEATDPVERAPLLWLSNRNVLLDGRMLDAQELEDELRTVANNYRFLHPYEAFRGHLDVLCSAQVEPRSLAGYLKAARRARYLHVTFVFTRRESQVRPILGKLSRVLATGAQATLVDEAEDGDKARAPGPQVLRLDAFRTYGDLARRLVELRKAGSEVSLVL